MPAKRPTKVKIGVFKLPIKYNKNLIQDETFGTCEGVINYYNTPEVGIEVSEVADPGKALMHEIIHGIVDERGLKAAINEGAVEHVVDQLSNAFTALIRENKGLINYVMED